MRERERERERERKEKQRGKERGREREWERERGREKKREGKSEREREREREEAKIISFDFRKMTGITKWKDGKQFRKWQENRVIESTEDYLRQVKVFKKKIDMN